MEFIQLLLSDLLQFLRFISIECTEIDDPMLLLIAQKLFLRLPDLIRLQIYLIEITGIWDV